MDMATTSTPTPSSPPMPGAAVTSSGLLAGAGMDGIVRLYDPVTCESLGTLVDNGEGDWDGSLEDCPSIFCMQISTDNMHLATGCAYEYITIWDLPTRTKKCVLHGHTCIVKCLSFSPEIGKLASVASGDRIMRIWDYIKGSEWMQISNGHDEDINEVCYSSSGTQLASSSYDKTVKIWNAVNGALICACSGHCAPAIRVLFSPDSRRVASCSADKTLRFWDPHSGEELLRCVGHKEVIIAMGYSNRGDKIASSGMDKGVIVWCTSTATILMTCTRHSDRVTYVRFRPDDAEFASCSEDGTVAVWDATDGSLLRTIQAHFICVCYSKDPCVDIW
jgi:WD40 repeat protein